MLLFGIILSVTAKAQIVTTNPLEYVALAEGNELILGKVKDQMLSLIHISEPTRP